MGGKILPKQIPKRTRRPCEKRKKEKQFKNKEKLHAPGQKQPEEFHSPRYYTYLSKQELSYRWDVTCMFLDANQSETAV